MSLSVSQLIEEISRDFSNSSLYYGHGTDSPLDEAAYLVLGFLGIPFDCSEDEVSAYVDDEDLSVIKRYARDRIENHRPIAYLINKAWFCGREFYVDDRVLVPRSPIAELINSDFSPWIHIDQVKHILEVGTGSGCIAISMAHAFENALIDATDIDDGALAVARHNIAMHQMQDRVNLYKADIYEGVPERQYDLIVSNPPYVGHDEYTNLPLEYFHEPERGLKTEENGIAIVRQLLLQAPEYLNEYGILIIEVGNSQHEVMKAFPNIPFTWLEFEFGGEAVLLITKSDLQ